MEAFLELLNVLGAVGLELANLAPVVLSGAFLIRFAVNAGKVLNIVKPGTAHLWVRALNALMFVGLLIAAHMGFESSVLDLMRRLTDSLPLALEALVLLAPIFGGALLTKKLHELMKLQAGEVDEYGWPVEEK